MLKYFFFCIKFSKNVTGGYRHDNIAKLNATSNKVQDFRRKNLFNRGLYSYIFTYKVLTKDLSLITGL